MYRNTNIVITGAVEGFVSEELAVTAAAWTLCDESMLRLSTSLFTVVTFLRWSPRTAELPADCSSSADSYCQETRHTVVPLKDSIHNLSRTSRHRQTTAKLAVWPYPPYPSRERKGWEQKGEGRKGKVEEEEEWEVRRGRTEEKLWKERGGRTEQ